MSKKKHSIHIKKPDLKKLGKKGQKVLQEGKIAAMMALFGPLVPLGVTFLHRRGIKPDANPKKLVMQIHNEMTKKSFGLAPDGLRDSFDFGLAVNEPGAWDMIGIRSNYGLVEELISPEMIQSVISMLKGIFNNIAKKKADADAAKAAGKPVPPEDQLTPDEQKIADAAPQLQKDLSAAAAEATQVNDKAEQDALAADSKMSPVMIIVIIIIIIIIFKALAK